MVRSSKVLMAVFIGSVIALSVGIRYGTESESESARPSTPQEARAGPPSPVLPVAPFATGSIPQRGAPSGSLISYVRGLTGRRFGGIWLDQGPPQSFRVGVVGVTAADRRKIRQGFRGIETPVSVVPAQFEERRLEQIVSWISRRLPRFNGGAYIPINVGLRPDLNAVQVSAPSAAMITKRQRKLVTDALAHFGSAVEVDGAASQPGSTLPCRNVFCDPPLRAGNWNYAGLTGCTGAFIARSKTDGKLYQLTAGHCRTIWNATWLTDFINGVPHEIGALHSSRFDYSGDGGIMHVNNPIGWRPRAWVTVRGDSGTTNDQQYPIWTQSAPVVGIRVCMSGAGSHVSNCGVVTRVDVTVTYLDRHTTVSGLVEANVCSVPGDSGSPVFAGHVAYGVVSGNVGSCRTLFEPIQTLEGLMHVNVAHDAR